MRTLTFASALALAAGAVQAGNLDPAPADPVVTPPPTPVVSPTANWTGPYGGVQLGYGFADTNLANVDGNGIVGGAHLGYDYDFGDYFMGVEGDFDFAGIDLTGNAGSLDSVGRLKLRGGFDTGPALVYATGGAAYANATLGGTGRSDWGWFGGVGMAYGVTENMTIGGEVLYHGFNDFDGTGIDVNATTITARASWRF